MYHQRSKTQSSLREHDLAERMNRPVLFTKSLPSRARISSSDFKKFQSSKEAWTTQKHDKTNTFPRSKAFRKIDLESQFQTELSKCLFEKALERTESKTCADDIALLKSRNTSLTKNKNRPSSSLSYWSSVPVFEMSQSLWTITTNCSDSRTSLNIKGTECKSAIVQNKEKFDTYFVNGCLDVRAVAKSHGPIETSTGNIHSHLHRIKSASAQNLHGHSLKYMYSDKGKESEYRKMMKLYIDKPPPAPPPPLTPAEKQYAREEALRILTEKLKAEEEERAVKEAQLKKEAEEKAAAEAAAAAAAAAATSRPSSSGKTVTFKEKLTSTKIIGGKKKGSRRGSPARKPSPTTGKNSPVPKRSFPGSGRTSPSCRKAPSSRESPKPSSPKGNTKKKKAGGKGKKGKSKKKDKQVEPAVTPPPEEPKPSPEPEPLPEPIKPDEHEQLSEPKIILLDDPPKYIPATEYKTRNKRVSDWLYSCSSAASGTYQPFL